MSISGLIVHARQEKSRAVRTELEGMKGVEVHAASPEGNLIVTVDTLDNRQATDAFVKFQEIDGVVTSSLVYNYFEDADTDPENPTDTESEISMDTSAREETS
jgi:nitrate reductase NapD